MGYMELSNNSLMLEAPGFIRGVNTKSKILLEDDKVLTQVVLVQGGWRQKKANIPNYPFSIPCYNFLAAHREQTRQRCTSPGGVGH
jgi:hypothetical protein